jgi:hypothetical protein
LYRALTEDECKCAAAAHASVANLIDLEGGITGCGNKRSNPCRQQAAALRSELLAYRAAAERNRAAAEALEFFFRLAEVEFGHDAIAQNLNEIDKICDFMARIRESGLEMETAGAAVHDRRSELLNQRAKLMLDRVRLNSELRRRTGLDVDDQTPLWPDTDLKVEVEQIDVDAAVAEGLAVRPDVAAAQLLVDCLDTNSLAHARTSLQAIDAVLGSATAKSCWVSFLGNSAACCEWATRAEQLEQMLVHLQRAAAEEIRQAVRTIETRLQQMAIAKHRLASREQALHDLVLQWGDERVTAFDIGDARMKVVEARGELVHQVIAWEIARVRLKRAQGLYALQCGYTRPTDALDHSASDLAAPLPQTDGEPAIDVPPPPVPSFVHEEPAGGLRQPASVQGNVIPRAVDAEDAVAPTTPPPSEREMPSPEPVELNTPALTTPDEGSDATDESAQHDAEETTTPQPRLKLPRDIFFGDKIHATPVAAPKADVPAVLAPQLPVEMKRLQPRPDALQIPAFENGRKSTRPRPAGSVDLDKGLSAPPATASVGKRSTARRTRYALQQPLSVANTGADAQVIGSVCQPYQEGTPALRPAESSGGDPAGRRPDRPRLRQPASVANAQI